MAFITCEKASFAYEGRTVIQELNLRIERGEYLCVIGENGSGKSTLIKGLLGLISPVHGRISYGDGLKRSEIGYLPQRTDVQNDFPASVWEVVSSGCRGHLPFLTADMRRTANENMELLGICSIRKNSFMELSGGQQQRVLLARALCATQRLLLLDEPVAGLDPLVTREMYEIISMLHRERGLTVVMISHDISAALAYASRILHMSNGATFLGTPNEYLQSAQGRIFAGGQADA